MSVVRITIDQPLISDKALPSYGDPHDLMELHVTFGKNVTVSSIGIRAWLNWIHPLSEQPNARIFLHECPIPIIHQVNLVSRFLPRNASIKSFYVRFASPVSGEEKLVILTEGVDFKDGTLNLPTLTDEAGRNMELDLPKSQYFRFLLGKGTF